MVLEYQPYIPGPPQGKEALWHNAVRSDEVTVKAWHDIWVRNTEENSKVSNFAENSAMATHHACRYQPVIVAGSGPSLKKNWKMLVEEASDSNHPGRCGIKMVSCLHNFGFMEDRDLMGPDDYYITLDAGEITLSEVTEGGKDHDPDWYWERTANRTLIAYHAAYPALIKKWKGKILWFTTPFSSLDVGKALGQWVDWSKVPAFNVGGCVLGAAWYFSRALLGCSVPIMIGADFSFGYDRKFHAWQSQYDSKFSGVMPWTDVYGNRVWTWRSYFGFKSWLDHQAMGGQGNNAQLMINATEGGILGSYADGNIQQIIQMDLKRAMHMFNCSAGLPGFLAKSVQEQIHLLM
jgi:hypothetical protein